MTDLALFSLLVIVSFGRLEIEIFSNGLLTEVAGGITTSVIIAWPILAIRKKDPEISLRKVGSAVAWGPVYNLPMMSPISVQIIKTCFLRVADAIRSFFGLSSGPMEEFIVRPKSRGREHRLTSVLSKLKAEILIGLVPVTVAVVSGTAIFLLFTSPQLNFDWGSSDSNLPRPEGFSAAPSPVHGSSVPLSVLPTPVLGAQPFTAHGDSSHSLTVAAGISLELLIH